MSLKECLICGRQTEAIGGTKYCPQCADMLKQSHRRNKKVYQIPGQSESLSNDVHAAIEEGISYGNYIGRRNSRRVRKNDNKR